MQITSGNFFPNISLCSGVQAKHARPIQESSLYEGDIFVKTSAPSFKGENEWEDIVGRERDSMCPKKYRSLSELEKNILRKQITESCCFKDDASETVKAAKVLKASLDEDYGKGKWVYISIGRSCAVLARALESMGVEAKRIPISNLSGSPDHGSEMPARKNFKEYKEYIYNLGLAPDKIVENSDKTYIFQDFTISGDSLRIFEEFMKTNEMGLDLGNVKFESVNERLKDSSSKLDKYGMKDFNIDNFIDQYLLPKDDKVSLKKYCSLPKFYYSHPQALSDAFELSCYKKACTKANLFEFAMLDVMANEQAEQESWLLNSRASGL